MHCWGFTSDRNAGVYRYSVRNALRELSLCLACVYFTGILTEMHFLSCTSDRNAGGLQVFCQKCNDRTVSLSNMRSFEQYSYRNAFLELYF